MAYPVLSFLVAALNIYAFVLVLARSWFFKVKVYRPMLLNIGLSIAPILVLLGAIILTGFVGRAAPWATLPVAILGGLTWLLMLPNAGYLITELNFSHRKEGDPTPLWFDIIAVLSLAMSGVANTVYNVFLAQIFVVILSSPRTAIEALHPTAWIVAFLLIILVTIGMYLGRYVRVYSWDIVHPIGFVRRVKQQLSKPHEVRNSVLFILTHTVFLALIYGIIIAPLLVQTFDW